MSNHTRSGAIIEQDWRPLSCLIHRLECQLECDRTRQFAGDIVAFKPARDSQRNVTGEPGSHLEPAADQVFAERSLRLELLADQ